jgi:hypothetical protein
MKPELARRDFLSELDAMSAGIDALEEAPQLDHSVDQILRELDEQVAYIASLTLPGKPKPELQFFGPIYFSVGFGFRCLAT